MLDENCALWSTVDAALIVLASGLTAFPWIQTKVTVRLLAVFFAVGMQHYLFSPLGVSKDPIVLYETSVAKLGLEPVK